MRLRRKERESGARSPSSERPSVLPSDRPRVAKSDLPSLSLSLLLGLVQAPLVRRQHLGQRQAGRAARLTCHDLAPSWVTASLPRSDACLDTLRVHVAQWGTQLGRDEGTRFCTWLGSGQATKRNRCPRARARSSTAARPPVLCTAERLPALPAAASWHERTGLAGSRQENPDCLGRAPRFST